jgi:AcrR family transcriptional regulator
MARPKIDLNRAQNIIEAADELFARYGYERTSMDDIARHLGIGKGSIYLDFRTKEDILFRILERHAKAMQTDLRLSILNSNASPLAILRDSFTTGCVSCYDRVTRDIHTPETFLHTSISMKKHFADFFVTRRRLIYELLCKAADAGEIPRSKATEQTALALMMATSSLYPPYLDNYSESVTIKSREDLISAAPAIVDLLLDGLSSS